MKRRISFLLRSAVSIVLVVLLSLPMVITVSAAAGDTGTTPDGFKWSDDGTSITITGYSGVGGNITIPSTINGKAVMAIGVYAFAACKNLISMSIPDTVSTINGGAFSGCIGLTNLQLPNILQVVPGGFLSDCTSLKNISLPASVKSIGYDAFARSGLTSFSFTSGDIAVGSNAFDNCLKLTDVNIKCSSLGNDVFKGCSSLTNVTFSGSLSAIPDNFFTYSTSLKHLHYQVIVHQLEHMLFFIALRSLK